MEYLLSLLSDDVNPFVFGFFTIGALLLLYIASYYLRTKTKTNRLFGSGLALTGVAFLFWAFVTGFQPANLIVYTTIGALLFLTALIAFFVSYVSALKSKRVRTVYWVIGAVTLTAFLAMRFLFFESNPGFSEEGFFSFNINQLVVYGYVVLLACSIAPASFAVATKMKNQLLAGVTRFGFALITIGTAILLTSPDNYMQTINGVGMLIGFFVLALVHSFTPIESK
jgi:drug/metabolite transporter (DMT)-like permease